MRWSVFVASFCALVVWCVVPALLLGPVGGTAPFVAPIAFAAVAGGLGLVGRPREGEAVIAGGLAATVLMVLTIVFVYSFVIPLD